MTVKFRHNISVPIAGIVGVFGAAAVALQRWWLSPILLLPALIIVWGWRAGVDVDSKGFTVRTLLGSRRVGWTEVDGFVASGRRRVAAHLVSGKELALPVVIPADVPRMLEAGGQPLSSRP